MHALIEHELGENVEEEMWKLIFWRAPLKVLMFYDWADREKITDSRNRWLTGKLASLVRMLAEVDQFHAEDPRTQYVFLICAREVPDDRLSWKLASNKALQPTPLTRRG